MGGGRAAGGAGGGADNTNPIPCVRPGMLTCKIACNLVHISTVKQTLERQKLNRIGLSAVWAGHRLRMAIRL